MERAGRVVVVFLDGVGLGDDDPAVNPLAAADLPVLRRLLEGRRPLAAAAPWTGDGATLVGLDACLGVAGLPQSGTGQAALLTGADAPRLFGRHFGPWTPTALRPLVEEESFLARALGAGRSVAFANAYPQALTAGRPVAPTPEQAARGARRPSPRAPRRARVPVPLRIGPVIAARAAGLLTRHGAELARGDGVASEITNDGWRERLGRTDVPRVEPEGAGANLARIAAAHDLTFYAHYATDTVGHRGSMEDALAVLARVDRFLGGVLAGLPGDALLLVVSDHGNLEDVRAGHTRNPALALAAGPAHSWLGEASSLRDVAPGILALLGAG